MKGLPINLLFCEVVKNSLSK